MENATRLTGTELRLYLRRIKGEQMLTKRELQEFKLHIVHLLPFVGMGKMSQAIIRNKQFLIIKKSFKDIGKPKLKDEQYYLSLNENECIKNLISQAYLEIIR